MLCMVHTKKHEFSVGGICADSEDGRVWTNHSKSKGFKCFGSFSVLSVK